MAPIYFVNVLCAIPLQARFRNDNQQVPGTDPEQSRIEFSIRQLLLAWPILHSPGSVQGIPSKCY